MTRRSNFTILIVVILHQFALAQITTHPTDQSVCVGEVATFTVDASGSPDFQWQENPGTWQNLSDGPGISGSTTEVLTFTNVSASLDGSEYRVIVTYSNPNTDPDTSLSAILTVNDVPATPTFTVDCSMGLDEGIINVTSPIGVSYEYRLDGGPWQADAKFEMLENGTYSLEVRENPENCISEEVSVLVDCQCSSQQEPFITLSSNSGSTCGTTPKTVSGNVFGGSATEVMEISADGQGDITPNSTGNSPFSFTYTPHPNDAGSTITITFITDDPLGCGEEGMAQYELTVLHQPILSGDNSVCVDDTTVVMADISGTWSSNPPGIVQINNSGQVIGLMQGSVSLEFTATNGCTADMEFTVNPLPQNPSVMINCDAGAGEAVVNVSPNNGNFEYSLDGGNYQNDNTFTDVDNGNHSIRIRRVSTMCESELVTFNVNCPCGNEPTLTLSQTNGMTCGTKAISVNGNSFGGSATMVTLSTNGQGTLVPASTNSSPFMFTYTPTASEIGSTVLINFNTDNPEGTPCTEAQATFSLMILELPVLGGDEMGCVGASSVVTPTSGGTWTSSNTNIATVTNSGQVTGMNAGTVTLTYRNNTTMCEQIKSFTVNSLPSVGGPGSVCEGSTITITPTSGGTWATDNPAIASVTNSGIVTGQSPGIVELIFTQNGTGCKRVKTITVLQPPLAPIVTSPVLYCVGETAAQLSAQGMNLSWNGSSTAPTPPTNSEGTTEYTVTQDDGQCESPPATIAVTVHPNPTASIQISETSGTSPGDGIVCSGEPVTLTVNSDGNMYEWSNGLGTGSSVEVTTDYSDASEYDYSVTAFKQYADGKVCQTDAGGTLTVTDIPRAGFRTQPDVVGIQVGGEINFIDTSVAGQSTEISQWVWDFDDGIIESGSEIYSTPGNQTIIMYPNGGSKQVCLTTTDNNNCADNSCLEFAIDDPDGPTGSLDVLTPASCVGDPITLQATIRVRNFPNWHVEDNITWMLPPGAVYVMMPVKDDQVYVENQTYVETAIIKFNTVSNENVVVTGFQTRQSTMETASNDFPRQVFSGNETPILQETPQYENQICEGESIKIIFNIQASSEINLTYNVNNSSGNSFERLNAGIDSLILTPQTSKDTIRLISLGLDQNLCRNDLNQELIIDVIPNPELSFNENVFCKDSEANLIVSGAETYEWLDTNVTNDTLMIPTNITGSSTYYVLGSTGSCSTFDSVAVTITDPPSPEIAGDQQVCDGQRAVYTAENINPLSNLIWEVEGGNVISGANLELFEVEWTSAANSVLLTEDIGACSGADELAISFVDDPTPPYRDLVYLNQGGILLYSNPENFDLEYQWFENKIELPGEVFQGLYVGQELESGDLEKYGVKVWYKDVGPDCAQVISRSSIEEELEIHPKVSIYPNPASNLLFLNITDPVDNTYHLVVYDAIGRLKETVMHEHSGGEAIVSLEISAWPSGIYYLILTDSNRSETIGIPITKAN